MTKLERVSEILSLVRRPVDVEFSTEYNEIGIRSFGRGIFHKAPVTGAALGSKRVYWIQPDDLVISNVFAWEGAIAVAADAESGRIGSHRFMTFLPVDDRVIPSWVAWFFRSEPGLRLIESASPGSAGRNRTLSIDRFLALEIPVPSKERQHEVAAWLSAASDRISAARAFQLSVQQLTQQLIDVAVWRLIERGVKSGWPIQPLGAVAEINPSRDSLSPDQIISFVPMAALDEHTGLISAPVFRRVDTLGSGYKQFRRGDVIFARITPCMQNGKTAIFDSTTTHGYGSTEFHVIRAGPTVEPAWVQRFLRTRNFREQAAQHLTGTAGQQRVSAEFLRTASIPVPSLRGQREIVTAIDGLLETGRALAQSRMKASELTAAIEPSMVNQAFAGLRVSTDTNRAL